MTAFTFEAARKDGARVRGQLDAVDQSAAAEVLSRRGLLPLDVRVAPVDSVQWWRRPPLRDQATAFRGLASLVDAGVPLQTALHVAARAGRGLRDILERVELRVREGASLGAALMAERGMLSPVTIGLVRAGERGTGLAQALDRAADQLEQQAETTARIRAALSYPLVLLSVGCASLALIVLVVVPRFVRILGGAHIQLPLASRLLIEGSTAIRSHSVLIGSGLAAAIVAAATFLVRQRSRWHEWALVLPFIGPLRLSLATARCGNALSALLASGTPALVAMDVARETVGDEAVARRLELARQRVAEGEGLTAALRTVEAMTPAALEMAAVGEHGGRLPDLLHRASQIEERDVERRVRQAVALLEPALILVFALLVAFVAGALLQALYSLRPAA